MKRFRAAMRIAVPGAWCRPGARANLASQRARHRRGGVGAPVSLLGALFFLSGAAGLVFEVVWQRALTRLLGSTVAATSTVVAAYMGGLALGAWLLSPLARPGSAGLRRYAMLELSVGLCAPCMIPLFGRLTPIHFWLHQALGPGAAFVAARSMLALVALLVPTALMGGTLPVLTAATGVEAKQTARYAGLLYGLNTLGAVAGTLAAGFVTIGLLGETGSVRMGAALNVIVGLLAGLLAARESGTPGVDEEASAAPGQAATMAIADSSERQASDRIRRRVLWIYGLSGGVALALEVLWTRQLIDFFLGTSLYSFTVVLATFLLGIGLGSLIGRRWALRLDAVALLAALEAALGVLVLLELVLIARVAPLSYVHGQLPTPQDWTRAALGVFGPTLVMGIMFPVALRACMNPLDSQEAIIGRLYAANTLGAIVGSLTAGFMLLPLLGSSRGIALCGATSILLAGLLITVVRPRPLRQPAAAVALVVLAGAMCRVAGDPYQTLTIQRLRAIYGEGVHVHLHEEESAATITAFESGPGRLEKHLWLNGYGMTSLVTITKLMAHLPLAIVPDARAMLVVCFGMGTTARSASLYQNVDVTVVDLVDGVFRAFAIYHPDASSVLARPNLHCLVEDGRTFLETTARRFDVINIDPAPPIYSAGSANLHSAEFLTLCREHLTDAGVTELWAFPSSLGDMRRVLATFHAVFPYASVWRRPLMPGRLLVGSNRPHRLSHAALVHALEVPAVAADLTEFDNSASSSEKIEAMLVADQDGVATLARGVPIVTDDRPAIELPWIREPVEGDGEPLPAEWPPETSTQGVLVP